MSANERYFPALAPPQPAGEGVKKILKRNSLSEMQKNRTIKLPVDFGCRTIKENLDLLLTDKTTHHNLTWGCGADGSKEITPKDVYSRVKTRLERSAEDNVMRKNLYGEVFTPAWLCNEMNSTYDVAYLAADSCFNTQGVKSWTASADPVKFKRPGGYSDYLKAKCLELTCGEAPFLASRYDMTTGEIIPVKSRIGLLDRKLRVAGEYAKNPDEWHNYAMESLKSVYGYDFLGESVFIARCNLLLTYHEHFSSRYSYKLPDECIREAAEILSWDIWQMDGLTDTVPNGKTLARTMDWDTGVPVIFHFLKKDG